MRLAQKTKIGGWLLLAVLLVAGCSSTVGGEPAARPGAGGTEPAFPKTKPSTPPTAKPPQPTASLTAPAGAIPLPPNQNGFVYIETKSGETRCQIDADNAGCQAEFTNSPIQDDGHHANGVNVNANGKVQWVLGNLGDIPAVTIDYRIYEAVGWTIDASANGTRFTNNRTGHGMFVSIEHVETF